MKTQDVRIYTAQRLHWLWALPDNQRRVELAKLRRGVGHAPGDLPELWGMIQLLSAAKDGGIPLDYPQLAADLYELQCTDPRYAQVPANVRLRWGQDLYRDSKPAPEENEKEN